MDRERDELKLLRTIDLKHFNGNPIKFNKVLVKLEDSKEELSIVFIGNVKLGKESKSFMSDTRRLSDFNSKSEEGTLDERKHNLLVPNSNGDWRYVIKDEEKLSKFITKVILGLYNWV